ncbi:MAG TPA: precorrin-8X methylmutase [Syntrophorhabdaceae bacterium]|jgi:precorrin-8X/cobalt-precorrin-8 methylmutase
MENILIIGHGSPKQDANNVDALGIALHSAIHPACTSECVKIAYLQYGKPGIMESIAECVKGGASKITVHPFFLSAGMHVTKDIPAKIAEARNLYPHVEFVYTDPLGPHQKLVEIVIERLGTSAIGKPADIEKRSFEIISGEFDLSRFPSDQAPVVRRVIHATADLEFGDTLRFSPDAIKAGIEAIKAGMDIVTDVEMVRAGISRKLLEPWGGAVRCAINDEEVAATSAHTGHTRAALSIERGLAGNVGIVAIGNAPTALLKTIEVLTNGTGRTFTPLVVGVPVGFVKALESKTLLAAQSLPYITNLGRKGGTPVAVAIVNALLKMASEAV